MGEVLTRTQLKRLKEHQYSAQGVSLLEPPFQRFWRWTVEQIPLWWAPNALTMAGLLSNALTTMILCIYSPDGKQPVPWWAYFLCAVGLFVYQTLDAIDGKQARRTNSSSPLGELFDHGCDSFSINLVILGVCVSLQLGESPNLMYFECFSTMFLFYAAHWQTFCSGTLKFWKLDVTEAQVSIILLYLVTAVFGEAIWATELPVVNMQLKMLPVWFSIVGAILACISNFNVIFLQGGVGRNGSTVAGTSVLSPAVPIGLLLSMSIAIYARSTTDVFHKYSVLYIVSIGTAAAKVTNKLVIAHMSRTEITWLDTSLIGPGLLFLNQYFGTYFNEYYVLWLCFIICNADLLHYSVQVCRQMCDYMDISCFRISPVDAISNGLQRHDPAGRITHSSTSSSSSAEVTSRPVTRLSSKTRHS